LSRVADRQAGGRVARAVLEELEVAVCVAGLALGGVAEEASDIRVTLDVRDLGEVEVAAVRLRLTRESGLQIVVRLRSLEVGHLSLPLGSLARVSRCW